VKRMVMRVEERRKKISNTKREKQDRGEKDTALEGKKAEREKRRQKICNENKGRREVSSERGSKEEAGRSKEKKRYIESEKEEMGRKRCSKV